MYILNDGTTVTADQITQAVENGAAVIIHGRKENGTRSGLMLDGRHFDTRGQCYSMWDEAWTETPASAAAALKIAHYHPK